MSFEYSFKVITLGDYGVGRSLLFQRFTDTIFGQFGTKIVNINGVSIQLQVWDNSRGEKFYAITRSYHRGTAAAIFIYDVSQRMSFEGLNFWISEAAQYAPSSVVKILVGNKADKQSEREVLFEEAQTFANSNDMIYLETSAITGLNVNKVFYCAAAEFLMRIRNGTIDPTDRALTLNPSNRNNKS